jgi:hypothetical protein
MLTLARCIALSAIMVAIAAFGSSRGDRALIGGAITGAVIGSTTAMGAVPGAVVGRCGRRCHCRRDAAARLVVT